MNYQNGIHASMFGISDSGHKVASNAFSTSLHQLYRWEPSFSFLWKKQGEGISDSDVHGDAWSTKSSCFRNEGINYYTSLNGLCQICKNERMKE